MTFCCVIWSMTDRKDPNMTPQGNAPSWVDEVLSAQSRPQPRVPEARHGGEARLPGQAAPPAPSGWDHWPQTEVARDLRLPEDPPRPAPVVTDARPFDSDDWVARATGGQVRDPRDLPAAPPTQPIPTQTTTYRTAPTARPDIWGDSSAPVYRGDMAQKKLIAALLAIFLGSFGVHKFYLGMNTPGLVMLGLNLGSWVVAFTLSLLTLFLGSIFLFPLAALVVSALGVVGLIEGIIYLTKSDADFEREYLMGKKPWF